MHWKHVLTAVGVTIVGGGGYAVWYSIANPLCLGDGTCGPNYPIAVIGLFVALVGVTVIFAVRRWL